MYCNRGWSIFYQGQKIINIFIYQQTHTVCTTAESSAVPHSLLTIKKNAKLELNFVIKEDIAK